VGALPGGVVAKLSTGWRLSSRANSAVEDAGESDWRGLSSDASKHTRIDAPEMTQRALQTAQERASEEIAKAEISPSVISNRK
jgi:hypothetical protein